LVKGHITQCPGEHISDGGIARPFVVWTVTHHCLPHGVRISVKIRLVNVTNSEAISRNDLSRVWLQATGKDFQQGGLAVTIPANNTHSVAVRQGNADRIQHQSRGILEGEVICAKQVSHPGSLQGLSPPSPKEHYSWPLNQPTTGRLGKATS
jgi:hypothetical protein